MAVLKKPIGAFHLGTVGEAFVSVSQMKSSATNALIAGEKMRLLMITALVVPLGIAQAYASSCVLSERKMSGIWRAGLASGTCTQIFKRQMTGSELFELAALSRAYAPSLHGTSACEADLQSTMSTAILASASDEELCNDMRTQIRKNSVIRKWFRRKDLLK